MAAKCKWNIALLIIALAVSAWGKPKCRMRFIKDVVCEAGKEDYVLRRGLVSDNNKTIGIKLKSCRITEVGLDAFLNNYNLEEIDLSHNKISHIEKGVFDGNPNLHTLRVSQNLLTKLPMGLFDQLPRFRALDISDNKITTLELGLFDHSPELTRLELSGNGLPGKNLHPSLFEHNSDITFLHLSGNDMSQLPDNILQGLRKLKILALNNCSLTEVPKFATSSNLKTLMQLRLQSNDIKRLDNPATFTNLENLATLDLLDNKIDHLHADVFRPLTKLDLLDLSFNKIQVIPENLFEEMFRLRSLDLSYNLIDTVPLSAFYGTRLTTLRLSSNRISYLETNFCVELRRNNDRLVTFEFENNPFQCACLLEILNEVKKLAIEYKSDTYKGDEAVCYTTNEFKCLRFKFELEYELDVRQMSVDNSTKVN